MNEHDQIEHALASQNEVEPSPFFKTRVMAGVRREFELPPLAFPIRRMALLAALLVLLFFVPEREGFVLTAEIDMLPRFITVMCGCAAIATVAYEVRLRLTR
jgi:hypothetical protein